METYLPVRQHELGINFKMAKVGAFFAHLRHPFKLDYPFKLDLSSEEYEW